MVNVAAPSSERVSTKALAAAGQFRAIALWLNEPLIPQGIYVQVRQDKRPGCILVFAEFERPPEPERLTQYICHLIWQLNSPLIEGIHLSARPVGESKVAWDRRVRVMTPALREQIKRSQGKGSRVASIPPAIARKHPNQTPPNKQTLFIDQVKTLRAFMLTGSAVAAFVFGCLVEVVLSAGQGPSLPFENRRATKTEVHLQEPQPLTSPQLPNIETVLADYEPNSSEAHNAEVAQPAAKVAPTAETALTYRVRPDRPNYVHGALEPVGVMEHERLLNPTDPTVTLVFGGDVTLDDLPYSDYEDDEQLLSGVSAYQQADVAMVNLDDSLATADTSLEEKFLNRQRPDVLDLLKAGGVDIVNLTSEHTLAFGEQGLTETLDVLDSSGIYRVGAGRNEREARRPEILDVKGQRIAYLSYDQTGVQSAYGSAGGVNAVSMHAIIEDIGAIRDEVDWLVVNFRWMEAIPEKPADFQTNLAQLAIEQGADLVVGHHPTQLQGAEIYKGRPIAYSLGDFVFGQSTEATTAESAVLQVSLSDHQMKVDLIPVKVHDGQPQRVSGPEATNILNKIQAASKDFATPMTPSVVLDARPTGTPESANSGQDNPFVEKTQDESSSVPTAEEASPSEPMLNVPLEPEDTFKIDVEPIPAELLDNWGPKKGPGTLYKPESALPSESRLNQPAEARSQPQNSGKSETSGSPSPELEPATPTPEVTGPAEGAISPHSEPLVGPLSALPIGTSEVVSTESEVTRSSLPVEASEAIIEVEASEVTLEPETAAKSPSGEAPEEAIESEGTVESSPTETSRVAIEPEVVPEDEILGILPEVGLQEVAPAAIPLIAQQQIGLPQPRVLKPLSELKPIEENSLIIDVQNRAAITEPEQK